MLGYGGGDCNDEPSSDQVQLEDSDEKPIAVDGLSVTIAIPPTESYSKRGYDGRTARQGALSPLAFAFVPVPPGRLRLACTIIDGELELDHIRDHK